MPLLKLPDVLDVIGRLYFVVSIANDCAGCFQVAANPEINGDRHAHHDQGTETQDDKPPNHPHGSLGYQKEVPKSLN